MKLVLLGSTGFVGSEVLQQCQQSSTIDSLVVLTRRPLDPAYVSSKTVNIIVKDFKEYSNEVIEAVADADGCIWTLGGSGALEVEVEYPLAFAKAVEQSRSQQQKPFRFVHCSGVLAERDQSKSLWFLSDGRRAKGQAERELLQLATRPDSYQGWQTYIMRPTFVAPKVTNVLHVAMSYMLGSIRVNELAIAAIQLATEGCDLTTLENSDLVEHAKSKK